MSLSSLMAGAESVDDRVLRKAKSQVDVNEPCFITMTSVRTTHHSSMTLSDFVLIDSWYKEVLNWPNGGGDYVFDQTD